MEAPRVSVIYARWHKQRNGAYSTGKASDKAAKTWAKLFICIGTSDLKQPQAISDLAQH